MSIIITNGHKQTGEVEFAGKHPDIFSTYLAASLVENLAKESDQQGKIKEFRADLNVQSLAKAHKNNTCPIIINIGGQLALPGSIDFKRIAKKSAVDLLEKAGYFKNGNFSPDSVFLNIKGITSQSYNLNRTTYSNKFADSCVVYGHYIAPPFGINGTFPSLAIAQKINQSIDSLLEELPELRPDGKVHVTIGYTKEGFMIEDIYISVAHQKNSLPKIRELIRRYILNTACNEGLKDKQLHINAGGKFDVYFLQADFGVSKAKDDVIITGGIHQLGTDRVWGKCLYKASSILIPYAFALSKVVCDTTGAEYASVGAYAIYGEKDIKLQLQDISPKFEQKRKLINSALDQLPKNRNEIHDVLGIKINFESYKLFNDVSGFHKPSKPWKNPSPELREIFIKTIRRL